MEHHNPKPTHQDLIKLLPSQGWSLENGGKPPADKDHTLEDLVRTAHEYHQKGDQPGLISRMETALELDLIQLQKLWEYLGLPI